MEEEEKQAIRKGFEDVMAFRKRKLESMEYLGNKKGKNDPYYETNRDSRIVSDNYIRIQRSSSVFGRNKSPYNLNLINGRILEALRITSENRVVYRNLIQLCNNASKSPIELQIGNMDSNEVVDMKSLTSLLNNKTSSIKSRILWMLQIYGFVCYELTPVNTYDTKKAMMTPMRNDIENYIISENLKTLFDDPSNQNIDLELQKLLREGNSGLKINSEIDPILSKLPDIGYFMKLYEEAGKSMKNESLEKQNQELKKKIDDLKKEIEKNNYKKEYKVLRNIKNASEKNVPYVINILDPNNLDIYYVYNDRKSIVNMYASSKNSGKPNFNINTGHIECNDIRVFFDKEFLRISESGDLFIDTPVALSQENVLNMIDITKSIMQAMSENVKASFAVSRKYNGNKRSSEYTPGNNRFDLNEIVINDVENHSNLDFMNMKSDSENMALILRESMAMREAFINEQKTKNGITPYFNTFLGANYERKSFDHPLILPQDTNIIPLPQGKIDELAMKVYAEQVLAINSFFGIEDADADSSYNKSSVKQVNEEKESLSAKKSESLVRSLRLVCTIIMIDQYSHHIFADAMEWLRNNESQNKNTNVPKKDKEPALNIKDEKVNTDVSKGFSTMKSIIDDLVNDSDIQTKKKIIEEENLDGIIEKNPDDFIEDEYENSKIDNNSVYVSEDSIIQLQNDMEKIVYRFKDNLKFSAVSTVIQPVQWETLFAAYRLEIVDGKTFAQMARRTLGISDQQMTEPAMSFTQQEETKKVRDFQTSLWMEAAQREMPYLLAKKYPEFEINPRDANTGSGINSAPKGMDNRSKKAETLSDKSDKETDTEKMKKMNNVTSKSLVDTQSGNGSDNSRPGSKKSDD